MPLWNFNFRTCLTLKIKEKNANMTTLQNVAGAISQFADHNFDIFNFMMSGIGGLFDFYFWITKIVSTTVNGLGVGRGVYWLVRRGISNSSSRKSNIRIKKTRA